MVSLASFAEQLERGAQDESEILAFVEGFAKLRLKGIIAQLAAPAPMAPVERSQDIIKPNWGDTALLEASGIEPSAIAGRDDPELMYLHIDMALQGPRATIDVYLGMTGLSDKQRRAVFPALSRVARGAGNRQAVERDTRRLNAWLDWVRSEGVDPAVFPTYHRHLGIHGASQNVGGKVGSAGATLAFMEALEEIMPGRIVDMTGSSLPPHVRTPLEIHGWLEGGGQVPRSILLDNRRAIVFSSDPDVAIFQSLGKPYETAAQAARAYEKVRRQPAARRETIHEFVVGEVKTATDRSNLHERLALGARETRDEVRTDRFLMMAILTMDLLRGGNGQRSGRTLESRDVERFSDVFNLYFAWGWDDARANHPEHWADFKRRLARWCGSS